MIAAIKHAADSWCESLLNAWDRFWFTAIHVETLAVLRIITGAMLLYSHLVLASELSSFIGTEAWINNDTARSLHDGTFGEVTAAWSYLWNLESGTAIWVHHLITIAVSAAFMVGLLTRITGPLAWFLQLMVIHRLMGSLFGLDQIVTYCAMYLAFTPCGAVFSVDAWLRKRRVRDGSLASLSRFRQWLLPADRVSVSANVATRLLQLHLCVIYLFGGLAKARGQLWWDGTALWYAVGNYEYQSWDLTFLADYPTFFTALTHVTLFWEVFYCALVWPKLTRPVVIGLAVAVHGGIAIFLGMATFGFMMIAANGIFLSPWLFRRLRGIDRPTNSMDTSPIAAHSNEVSELRDAETQRRIRELDEAEEAFKKRYLKLKKREAKVDDRNERLKETKSKLRQKLHDGTLSLDDVQLDHLESESGMNAVGGMVDSAIDLSLSDPDLLSPDSDSRSADGDVIP